MCGQLIDLSHRLRSVDTIAIPSAIRSLDVEYTDLHHILNGIDLHPESTVFVGRTVGKRRIVRFLRSLHSPPPSFTERTMAQLDYSFRTAWFYAGPRAAGVLSGLGLGGLSAIYHVSLNPHPTVLTSLIASVPSALLIGTVVSARIIEDRKTQSPPSPPLALVEGHQWNDRWQELVESDDYLPHVITWRGRLPPRLVRAHQLPSHLGLALVLTRLKQGYELWMFAADLDKIPAAPLAPRAPISFLTQETFRPSSTGRKKKDPVEVATKQAARELAEDGAGIVSFREPELETFYFEATASPDEAVHLAASRGFAWQLHAEKVVRILDTLDDSINLTDAKARFGAGHFKYYRNQTDHTPAPWCIKIDRQWRLFLNWDSRKRGFVIAGIANYHNED